jgi:hypothetical protein
MFSKEELEEIRRCVNTMISERIKYKFIENNEVRMEINQKYLQMDYDILEKVLKELESEEE